MIRTRWDLINHMIEKYDYTRYLEIGLDSGETFSKIKSSDKTSVDPAQEQYKHARPTHKMTSDEFFENVAPTLDKFDIIFIDGLHHSDQVDKDIQNSLKYLNAGGCIILHDCAPVKEEHQIVPRISRAWNGDVWKSVVRFRQTTTDLGIMVLDTDHGLGIIHENIPVTPIDSIPELTWSWYVQNKKDALNLVNVENFSL